MGIFSKKPESLEKVPSPPAAKGAPPAATLSIVGVGMVVRGDLESSGVVKVEGTVDGNVRARAQVLVAKAGAVHGDIETAEAVIGGTVSGAIRAGDRVEVQAGASVEGDVTTKRISVAEGGSLNGLIRMGPAAADEPTGAKSAVRTQPGSGALRTSSVPGAELAMPPQQAV